MKPKLTTMNLVSKKCRHAHLQLVWCLIAVYFMQEASGATNTGWRLFVRRSIASNETANNRINSTDSGSNSSNINGSTAATDLTGNGLLPLCRNCFGHGVNPSLDPRCRLGCRGGGQPTGAAPLPTRMAFAANRAPRKDGCHEIDGCSKPPYSSVIIDNSAGLPRKEQKETYIMKVHALWFCFGVLCLLTLVGLVMMIIRKVGCKKRQARVDVHNKTCTVEINAVDSA